MTPAGTWLPFRVCNYSRLAWRVWFFLMDAVPVHTSLLWAAAKLSRPHHTCFSLFTHLLYSAIKENAALPLVYRRPFILQLYFFSCLILSTNTFTTSSTRHQQHRRPTSTTITTTTITINTDITTPSSRNTSPPTQKL